MTASSPRGALPCPAAACSISARSASTRRAPPRKRSPTSVRLTARVVRLSRRTPSRASRSATARVTAVGERLSRRAAAVKLPRSGDLDEDFDVLDPVHIIPNIAIISCEQSGLSRDAIRRYIREQGAEVRHEQQQRTGLSARGAPRPGRARLGRRPTPGRSSTAFPTPSRRSSPPSSPSRTRRFSAPPRPTARPTSSIAADRRASSRWSTSSTLGFADYRGNRQYITLGNLSENDRAYLFLIDFSRRQRIKLWGRARVVENDDALIAKAVRPRLQGASPSG